MNGAEKILIFNCDCLDLLRSLPDNSIDYINTDPPYFIGYDGGAGWDRQWATESDYLAWSAEWSEHLARVLKPNRMLTVWGTLKTDLFLRYKLEILNNIPELKSQNEIIWSYNWGGRSTKNFARKHEIAWNFSKGEQFLFNADDVKIPRKVKKSLRTGDLHSDGTIPTCVWEKNNHTMSADFIGWHPTVKNLDVISRFILAYSNNGDLVLDCFSGSGTTALACKRLGRNFVGCDLSEEYVSKSKERLGL